MTLENRLEEMKNKIWMYRTRLHRLLNYKISDTDVQIVTDKDWFTIPITKINKTLDEFLPVGEEEESAALTVFKNKNNTNIKDLIFENIEKIKNDKNFIPQAKALNEQVKTLINMAMVEIKLKKINNEK